MKKIIFYIILVVITISFILCPVKMTNAAKSGIMIWFNNIFPALFPCIIISNILIGSNILDRKSALAKWIILICGLCFGFPIGAKLTTDFYKKNYIPQKQAQALLSCSNHFSPSFIGAYAIGKSLACGALLIPTYLIIYLPSIATALFIFKITNAKEKNTKKSTPRFKLNMQTIDAGIINGFESLIKLCGYIVIFSIIINIVNQIPINSLPLINPLIGMIEATNGITQIAASNFSLQIKYIEIILVLSFGGLSCIAQTNSLISDTDLSIKNYIRDKLCFALVSLVLVIVYLFFFLN